MQTNIPVQMLSEPGVARAEEILRACVHCGFCTAVCPTYLELGDELDSPRGRIYIIKEMLENDRIEAQSQAHLDRCLTCRSCETACPSGVEYGQLLDVGKQLIHSRYGRAGPPGSLVASKILQWFVPSRLFSKLYRLGQWLRPLVPAILRKQLLPLEQQTYPLHDIAPGREIVLLEGCVQRAATPGVNQAIAYLLSLHGIRASHVSGEGCCGGIDHHMGDRERAQARIARNLDLLQPMLDQVECIVSSASGCGVTCKEYPQIMSDAPGYAEKAVAVAEKVRDVSELLVDLPFKVPPIRVAVHTPCTLQHGQGLPTIIEDILGRAGAEVVLPKDAHLCCGSAGTYSLLQPKLSARLARNKARELEATEPEVVVTANIGCQTQLAAYVRRGIPVMHWTEFLARNQVQAL